MPTLANLRELLLTVHNQDQNLLVEKDKSYEGSWKNDGGVGAYFTFKRPIDRFIAIAKRNKYDIFQVWQEEEDKGILFKDGTLSACVLDIRCYMALLQTEMMARRPYQPTVVIDDKVPNKGNGQADKAVAILSDINATRNKLGKPPITEVPPQSVNLPCVGLVAKRVRNLKMGGMDAIELDVGGTRCYYIPDQDTSPPIPQTDTEYSTRDLMRRDARNQAREPDEQNRRDHAHLD